VVKTIGTVTDMTAQLDAANRDLTDAVSVMTNGGPPLEDTVNSDANSQTEVTVAPVVTDPAVTAAAAPGETVHTASVKVEAANHVPFPAAPAITPAPAVAVTASTIAAAQAAAALKA
jgi:hypothetical protein